MLTLTAFTPLLTVDPSLGRLDYESLSDQALMEMLIDGLQADHKALFQDANGNFQDVCEWKGITCTDDRVTSIDMPYIYFDEKQFPFEFVPPHVTEFFANMKDLHGTLDASQLPLDLRYLSISDNVLHGSVDIGAFPRKMKTLLIERNIFSGSLSLSDLPPSLLHFDASNNQIIGEISLNALPPAMMDLRLNGNKLRGTIVVENLPRTMRYLFLQRNAFQGDFRLLSIPPVLTQIDLSKNACSGTLVFPKLVGARKVPFSFNGKCKAVIDEDGEVHPWEETIRKRVI